MKTLRSRKSSGRRLNCSQSMAGTSGAIEAMKKRRIYWMVCTSESRILPRMKRNYWNSLAWARE